MFPTYLKRLVLASAVLGPRPSSGRMQQTFHPRRSHLRPLARCRATAIAAGG